MGDLNRAARLATDQGNIAVVAGDALRVTGPNAGCYTAAGRTPAACTTAP